MSKKNCPVVSIYNTSYAPTAINPKDLDNYTSFIDYNDAEIWQESNFKQVLSCQHEKVKKVMLFTSHYFVCEKCGEEVK